MKGRKLTEEGCLVVFSRKGIIIDEASKRIGIPAGTITGNKVLGRLDFMKLKGWKIINDFEGRSFSQNFENQNQSLTFGKDKKQRNHQKRNSNANSRNQKTNNKSNFS